MSDQVPRSDRGKQGERSTLRGWLSAAIVATVVAGSVVAGVAALNAQAALDDQPVQRPLLTVDAATLQMAASYQASQRFIGRIEPARETQVAFELSGIVREMRFDEGDRVRSNDVVAILDTDALSIDRARLMAERSALEADLALAEATTLRREALQGRGFESGQSFDEARFSADAVRARIAGVDARLNRIALDIEKSSLRAPFDGVVSVRSIDEGAVVGAGASVLTLQETTRPQARIGVPVDVAQMLELGALLSLEVAGISLEGELVSIAPTLDPATRTVALLIDLPAASGAAMGEIARLEINRRIEQAGAWVPLSALKEAARGLWSLQTVIPAKDAAAREAEAFVLSTAVVEVIYVRAGAAFVRGSLKDGSVIVLNGPHRGAIGQRVILNPVALSDGGADEQ